MNGQKSSVIVTWVALLCVKEWWVLKTNTHYYCDLASFPSELKSKQVRGNYTPLFTTEASTVLKVWVILDAKVG